MIIRATISEVQNILRIVANDFEMAGLQEVATQLSQVEAVNGKLCVKKTLLGIGNVELIATIEAVDRVIELDIESIKVLGVPDLFGVLRVKVAKVLVNTFQQWEPKVKLWKHKNGNLRLSVLNLTFKAAGIIANTVVLEVL